MGGRSEGDITMALLAELIRPRAGRFVVDKTGLTGSYRVKLEMARWSGPNPDPSVFTALPDQLGLKLEASRAERDRLVVDYIERPSEN